MRAEAMPVSPERLPKVRGEDLPFFSGCCSFESEVDSTGSVE